ncbi:MAG: hypothetical protein ACE5HE_12385 [Phycisphaerae bacterium]
MFVVALLARGAWGGFRLAQTSGAASLEFPDERQYWLMATSLHSGTGLRDEFGFRATRMPLYPAVLSLAAGLKHGVVVAKTAQWLVGAAAAALVVAIATRLCGHRVGIVAGLFVALDPFLVCFASLLLTETLFTAGVIVLWWLVVPILVTNGDGSRLGRWTAIGFAAAACAYVRESAVGLVALLLVLVTLCRGFDRRILVGVLLSGSIMLATLSLWAVRNNRVTGDCCWLTHRLGISLYDGVGPQADGSSNLGGIQQMDPVLGMDEVAWNRFFLRESFAAMRADPARVARLAVTKLGRTWNPFPNVATYQSRFARLVSAVWCMPMFSLAVVGVILMPRILQRGGWGIAALLLLPALYVSALHTVFVGSVRYRIAAMPMLEILSAFALVVIVERGLSGRLIGRPTS